jgi:hypothetical protein
LRVAAQRAFLEVAVMNNEDDYQWSNVTPAEEGLLPWLYEAGENKSQAILVSAAQEQEIGASIVPKKTTQKRQKGRPRKYSAPTAEDERLLCKVYGQPRRAVSKAMKIVLARQLLARHPDWTKAVLNRVRRKLGVHKHYRKWTEEEVRELLDTAGEKSIATLQKMLRRSAAAIRMKLTRLTGRKVTKVESGYSWHEVRRLLHIGIRRLNYLVEQEVLELSDPAIPYRSLKKFVDKHAKSFNLVVTPRTRQLLLRTRKPKEQKTIASILGVEIGQVKLWVNANLLLPVDRHITAESFETYCELHQAELRTELMSRDERHWFYNEFDGWQQNVPGILSRMREMAVVQHFSVDHIKALFSLDEPAAIRLMNKMGARAKARNSLSTVGSDTPPPPVARKKMIAFLEKTLAEQAARAAELSASRNHTYRLKHLQTTRRCVCLKQIKGNAYFRHIKSCKSVARRYRMEIAV